ncbi:MAG TPA: hypothetical protein VFC65_03680 [Prolixibacteraceae bacterium]|nr:hypothetical protein [Prolixibacteraceae bacterium]
MKVYQANEELAGVLLNQGYVETSSEIEKGKGKKRFKLSHFDKKEIYFNYINIEIIDHYSILDSRIKMTDKELKVVLLYFKLSSADFKEFSSTRDLKIEKMEERLASLYKQSEALQKFGTSKTRTRLDNISRILENYESIIL